MEFTKDINLNIEKPIKGQPFTINYSGELFKNNSDAVFIVYGYGQNWENTTELQMEKNSDNYSVTITPLQNTEFNFCFKNNNNVWDNNSYKNYSINIENNDIVNQSDYIELVNETVNLVDEEKFDKVTTTEPENIEPITTEEIENVQNTLNKEKNENTERKTFNIDAIIDEILNTEITIPEQPVVQNYEQEVKQEKIIVPNENPTHVNKTSLLVEDVLVPFYSNENRSQFLPVDTQTYSKFFTFKRKIKLALYRILHTIPKLLTGNYKKKKANID